MSLGCRTTVRIADEGWGQVTTTERPPPSTLIPPSPVVQQLLEAIEAVAAEQPADLPCPQALADAAALLGGAEALRAALLPRLADVEQRALHTLDGAPSAPSWIEQQQTSIDRGELALARRLRRLPLIADAVREGRLPIRTAGRLAGALDSLRSHVDRPDRRIDGLPEEPVITNTLWHIGDMICQALGGLADDDPRLDQLTAALGDIASRPEMNLSKLEAGVLLLAQHLPAAGLSGALEQITDALLPSKHEDAAAQGHAARGVTVTRNADGSGWHVSDGELDLETGELLHAVIHAEMAVDPDNPADTEGFGTLREQGWESGDQLPAGSHPRSLRQKRHDALRNALRRLLDSGALGTRDKVAPHIGVTISLSALHAEPGAMPGVSTVTGAPLPLSLIRQWWCDSTITRFVLSLGHKVIEISHTERTLKPHERRAKQVETGGRCQVAGCRCGPGNRLHPHHPEAWSRTGTTSCADTVMLCDAHHHDIHTGRKTISLKDGRSLGPEGWADGSDR